MEILLGDLYNIRLPIVEDTLSFDDLVTELDLKFRNSEPVEEIVKWIDNQLKKNSKFTGKQFDKTVNMWKKLNTRRTNK